MTDSDWGIYYLYKDGKFLCEITGDEQIVKCYQDTDRIIDSNHLTGVIDKSLFDKINKAHGWGWDNG